MDDKEKIDPGKKYVPGGVKDMPGSPGVYLMKDEAGTILYVGKADNLKKRVSGYFRPRAPISERIGSLVLRVKDVSFIQTSTSAEALLYENSLIKQFSPKYNVALKDGKSYPMLKLTVGERFPRLFITRQKKADGAVYYGPYTNAKLLKEAVKIARRVFPLRTCKRMRRSPCLNHHIKQCVAPCAGKIDEARYGEMVSHLRLFLEGKRSELLNKLNEKMALAAQQENFEDAARIRDRIEALAALADKVNYRPLDEVEELRSVLGMAEKPETIEAIDVSNMTGKEAVGSVIRFYRGRPRKDEYRRFRIKTVSSIDDYGMIREVLMRRYARLSRERKAPPDLILIDGGRGHLNTALEVLRTLGLCDVTTIGLAKEFEHIYAAGEKEPIVLPRGSKALHLLERIRDEAHRFALAYHKTLLSKRIRSSPLDDIPGIGKTRKRELLKHFGSLDRIKTATMGELVKVEGMNEKASRNLVEYFKR